MTSKNKPNVNSAVDAINEVGPPLDFSFKMLGDVQESLDEEPRPGIRKLKKNEDGTYCTMAVRLNNNTLTQYSNLPESVEKLLPDPKQLAWLDLSFNELSTVDKCLLEYPNLIVLNLHGNDIKKINEVDKLAALPNLTRLTLHGNPIEEIPGYRNYILSTLPNLTTLDFQRVTKQDTAVCSTWKEMFGDKFRKKAEKQARAADKLNKSG